MDSRENLLYRPDLKPNKNYWSDGIVENQPIYTDETEAPTTFEDRIVELKNDIEEIKEISKYVPDNILPIIHESLNKMIEQINITYKIKNEINDEASNVIDSEINIEANDVVGSESVYDEEGSEIINETDSSVSSKTGDKTSNQPGIDYIIYNPQNEEALPNIPLIIDTVEDYTYLDEELPSLLPNQTDIEIEILKPKTLVDIIKNSYEQDSIDLKEDYVRKLQVVVQKYIQEMVMVMIEAGVSNIEDLSKPYDGVAVKIPNKNLQHLGDYITRSQIMREQKIRLFKKIHNVDQTIAHMRALHAAEKQRERYYGESYNDSETYLKTQSNSLLRESRALYDKKYDQTLYDMYKYLNSSVIIIEETLKMSLKESQAKGMLLKNGINIYVTQEIAEMVGKEAASSSVKASVSDGAVSSATDKKDSGATKDNSTASKDKSTSSDLSEKSKKDLSKEIIDALIKAGKEDGKNILKDAKQNIKEEAKNALKDFGKRLFNK